MDAMNSFKRKGNYPFQQADHPVFPMEHLHEVKSMIKHYHSILNEDFWSQVHQLSMNKHQSIQLFPIEIWESEDYIYLSVIIPGLANFQQVRLRFHNDQTAVLHIHSPSSKPGDAQTLVKSELPQQPYERDICFRTPVDTADYSFSYEHGVLTYTLKKKKERLDIPFDF
ncbi:Hsp20/alpha crystallin family protein [Bacillus thermotolerans]|uniref:Hsp20/alpha crystallin family protein n=1 Tax=Bacillus thermotolerans TaxID=1221996 RepID=A0A0F5HLI1_BACTR|nr:hypothetical protein [Bacillus thermotolerans]KKB34244.1 hypothetical protein QY97_02568 [Bacillus thermotolerans]KKB41739.1 hypothetical protein QY95_00546 [Bacillus thermotolerans]KKB44369.1 hypothetical protein QY96_02969 [Bacillus thermotolerans]